MTRALYVLFFSWAILLSTNLIHAQIQADFKADTTIGCGSIGGLNFTDLSTGGATSWRWEFGNGNTSTNQNPSTSYSKSGEYSVKLVVSDGTISDSVTKNAYIKIYKNPSVDYSIDTASGCPPFDVKFTDITTVGSNPISRWDWDFGDGSLPANQANQVHTYNNPGTYSTSLLVTDDKGCEGIKTGPSVTVFSGPIARFSSSGVAKTCTPPLTVNFLNQTRNQTAGTTYLWRFGDGTTSTQKSPSKTYSANGLYTVTLITQNAICSDSITIKDFVQIATSQASFAAENKATCLKDSTRFINNSKGGNDYLWDFGDGKTSTLENPAHLYGKAGTFNVKLSISSGPNCTDDTTITIDVEEISTEDFTITPGDLCVLPDTQTFKVTANNPTGTSYEWAIQTKSGTVRESGIEVTHIQLDNGPFTDTLIAIGPKGCKSVNVIRDSRKPTGLEIYIIPEGETVGCAPLEVGFKDSIPNSRSNELRYWDFDNGDTSNQELPPKQIFPTDKTYTVKLTVIDEFGCIDSTTYTVEPGAKSNPIIFVDKDTACWDDTVTLSHANKTNKIDSWKWMLTNNSGEVIGQGVREKFEVQMHRDSGNVAITLITENNACFDTTIKSPGIYVKGAIAAPYVIRPDCDSIEFLFYSYAKFADSIAWDFGDGSPISNDSIALHKYADTGTYPVKYFIKNSDATCSDRFDSIPLVYAYFHDLEVITDDSIGCKPFTGEFRIADQNSDVVWYRNRIHKDSIIGYGANLTHTMKDTGLYYIAARITDRYGCVIVVDKQVRVYDVRPSFSFNYIGDCIPQRVAFSDDSGYDTSFKSVEWDYGDGSFGSRQLDTAAYFPLDSLFTVKMVIEDVLGCKDSLIKKDLILTPTIIIDFSIDDRTLCVGDDLDFDNISIGPNQSYVWDFGDGNTSNDKDPRYAYQSEKVFDVILTMNDGAGCEMQAIKNNLISVQAKPIIGFKADKTVGECAPALIRFEDTSKSDFKDKWEWNFGDGAGSFLPKSQRLYDLPGKYDVSLKVTTSNGCVDSLIEVEYIEIFGPVADFTISDDSICKGEEVIFTMINPNNVGSFSWEFGDGLFGSGSPVPHTYNQTGSFTPTLLLRDLNGDCPTPVESSLFVEDVIANYIPDGTLGCEPFKVQFENLSNRADLWEWDFGDGNGSPDYNATHTFENDGIYQVKLNIANDNGCVDSLIQEIIVQLTPEAFVTKDTVICEGDTITITAGGGEIYKWSPLINIASPNSDTTLVYPLNSTRYIVEVSTADNCSDTAEVLVEVQQKPETYTLEDSVDLIIGEEVYLDVSSGNGFVYTWTPELGLSCADCPTPIAKPLESTAYRVDIKDLFGCFSLKDSIYFNVDILFSLDLPNGFSPNNDGNNDKIYVKGWGIKELLEFKIFNRFGELVYDSQNLEEGWDGTYRGQPQNIETYIYVVSVLTFEDEVLSKKGNISLIR